MGTGYTRKDTSNNIANGNVIDADDIDAEFNGVEDAFHSSTGHTHDGTSAEGAPIEVTGPNQEYVSDATALYPKADDTYDLGKTGSEWKDLYIDGTANIDTLTADAGTVGGSNITTTDNTQTLTNKTLDSATNTVTVDLSEATVTGTLSEFNTALSDDNFVSLTGSETLTNKTLTSPDINGGTIDGATVDGRDVGADGSKLDGIEANADVTDTANVTAAGALMDSELTDIAAVKALDQGVATTDSPSFAGVTATTADINGGTIDGTVIGGSTPAAISGTTGTFSGDLTVDTDALFVDASTNRVGIGTSNPSNPLHVVGEGTFTRGLELGVDGVDATSYILQYRSTVETVMGPLTTRMLFGTVSDHDIAIQTNNTEAMRIDSSGNVGIGTSSPEGALHVDGGDAYFTQSGDADIFLRSSTAASRLWFSDDDSLVPGAVIYLHSSDAMFFRTNNSERLRIDSSGNVGIGTSSPSAELDVNGTISAGSVNSYHVTNGNNNTFFDFDIPEISTAFAEFRFLRNTNTSGTKTFKFFRGNETSTVDAQIGVDGEDSFFNSGNVGIGTSSPGSKLSVVGLPTSASGLSAGDIYIDGTTLKIVT